MKNGKGLTNREALKSTLHEMLEKLSIQSISKETHEVIEFLSHKPRAMIATLFVDY